jgi:hypothetical protein
MFCPRCGADKQTPEAYCTRCGAWLADPDAVERLGPRALRRARTPEQKLRLVLIFNALDALMALFCVLALATLLGPNAPGQAIVVMILSVIIALHQLISFKLNLDLRKRLKRGRENATEQTVNAVAGPVEQRALGAGETTQFVAPASVTERTTELLERERGGRR